MLLNAISQLESVASLTHVYTHTRTRAFFLVGLTQPNAHALAGLFNRRAPRIGLVSAAGRAQQMRTGK